MTSTLDRPTADGTGSSGADRALDVLRTTHRTALGLLDARWSDARVALEAGVDVARVAEAMDLTIPQVVDGMRAWVDQAVRDGRVNQWDEAKHLRELVSTWPARSGTGPGGPRTGPGRIGWSVVDPYGQPRCLPGCTSTDVWDHLCVAAVGAVAQVPFPDGRVDAVSVEVDQYVSGRQVVICARDPEGYLRGDAMAIEPDQVPELVQHLLTAHRTTR